MNGLKNKYFVKTSANDAWVDVTSAYNGLRILQAQGMDARGEAVNVYNEQWVNSQSEDCIIASATTPSPTIVRKNVDLEITFIVSQRYATTSINVREVHDSFVDLMMGGEIWFKSLYEDKEVKCIAMDGYDPTTTKLHRGDNSYMMGTLKLHMLDNPSAASTPSLHDMYIGFGESTLTDKLDIEGLDNVQHTEKYDPKGSYTITCPSLSYLWICIEGATIERVTSSGFEVPMEDVEVIDGYNCYRSSNSIVASDMGFDIE